MSINTCPINNKDKYESIDTQRSTQTMNPPKGSKIFSSILKDADFIKNPNEPSLIYNYKTYRPSSTNKRIRGVLRQKTKPNNYNINHYYKTPLQTRTEELLYKYSNKYAIKNNINNLSQQISYTSPYSQPIYHDDYYTPNKRCISPYCHFDRSDTLSSNRTQIKNVNYSINSNNNNIYIKKTKLCCCNHPSQNVCSTCCTEHYTIRNLYNLIKDIIEKDFNIESIKEALSFCPDANLTDLFTLFDVSQRGSISPIDLNDALKQVDLYLSSNDIQIIYMKYDINKDGRLE